MDQQFQANMGQPGPQGPPNSEQAQFQQQYQQPGPGPQHSQASGAPGMPPHDTSMPPNMFGTPTDDLNATLYGPPGGQAQQPNGQPYIQQYPGNQFMGAPGNQFMAPGAPGDPHEQQQMQMPRGMQPLMAQAPPGVAQQAQHQMDMDPRLAVPDHFVPSPVPPVGMDPGGIATGSFHPSPMLPMEPNPLGSHPPLHQPQPIYQQQGAKFPGGGNPWEIENVTMVDELTAPAPVNRVAAEYEAVERQAALNREFAEERVRLEEEALEQERQAYDYAMQESMAAIHAENAQRESQMMRASLQHWEDELRRHHEALRESQRRAGGPAGGSR